MSDHDGIVFYAGGPDGSVNCAAQAHGEPGRAGADDDDGM
jgi:hypothetical protein